MMRRRHPFTPCSIALLILLNRVTPLRGDDDERAGRILQDLNRIKDQVRRQLSDIYGQGSSQLTDGFDGKVRKLDSQGGNPNERAINSCAVYIVSVNQMLVDLYGSSDYAIKIPSAGTPLSDVDGKTMTDLIQRVEDIQIVLRENWQHKPR